MHEVLQAHYHKDPRTRFPHIPSLPVTFPVSFSALRQLCYSSRYQQQQLVVSGEDIQATAVTLLEAVQQLEADTDAKYIQQTNQEGGGKPLRKFFIKRNYSGAGSCTEHNIVHQVHNIIKCMHSVISALCMFWHTSSGFCSLSLSMPICIVPPPAGHGI